MISALSTALIVLFVLALSHASALEAESLGSSGAPRLSTALSLRKKKKKSESSGSAPDAEAEARPVNKRSRLSTGGIGVAEAVGMAFLGVHFGDRIAKGEEFDRTFFDAIIPEKSNAPERTIGRVLGLLVGVPIGFFAGNYIGRKTIGPLTGRSGLNSYIVSGILGGGVAAGAVGNVIGGEIGLQAESTAYDAEMLGRTVGTYTGVLVGALFGEKVGKLVGRFREADVKEPGPSRRKQPVGTSFEVPPLRILERVGGPALAYDKPEDFKFFEEQWDSMTKKNEKEEAAIKAADDYFKVVGRP